MMLEAEPQRGIRLIPVSNYLKDYKGIKRAYKGQIVIGHLKEPIEKEKLNRVSQLWAGCTDKAVR